MATRRHTLAAEGIGCAPQWDIEDSGESSASKPADDEGAASVARLNAERTDTAENTGNGFDSRTDPECADSTDERGNGAWRRQSVSFGLTALSVLSAYPAFGPFVGRVPRVQPFTASSS
jgi:hypothetical protein